MTLQNSSSKVSSSLTPETATEPWESVESLKLLLEAAPMAIVTTNRQGDILFVNAKLVEMFGFDRDELVGHPVERLIPNHLRDLHVAHRQHYVDHPHNRPMGTGLELLARRKDGSEFPIEVGLSYINNDKNQDHMLIIGSINDISLRKQSEEILERRVEERTREIERRRQVADGLREILKTLNSNRSAEEILSHIVAQASRLLGADASAVYRLQEDGETLAIQTSHGLPEVYLAQGRNISGQGITSQSALTRRPVAIPNLIENPIQGDAESKARWQELISCGYKAVLAVPLLVKDDVYGSLVLYYSEPRAFSREAMDLAITFTDQAALAIENARLRTQVEQAAILAERNRLARDLHDSVTQTLFSASLIAEVLPKLWERKHDEALRRLEELRQLTRGALAEMRTLLLELRPSRLTDISISDLLRQLTEAVTGRARVPIELDIDADCVLLPDVQVAIYRTAQEALNNIAKHAQATHASVTLTCTLKQVTLLVEDDGLGFDPTAVKPNSLGLTIMHERAEAIGADLTINTAISEGTRVQLIWNRKAAVKKG